MLKVKLVLSTYANVIYHLLTRIVMCKTGSEFQSWDPIDWVPNPPFLNEIDNTELRIWAQKLNEAWKFLGRQIKGMGTTFIALQYLPTFYQFLSLFSFLCFNNCL